MSASWQDRCREAAALFDQGEHARAAEIFEEIVADESLVQTDRAMMYVNLATAYEKLGSKLKVMNAYEKASEWALHPFVFVETARAQWLLSSGQAHEAAAAVERLTTLPLSAEQRKRAEENLRSVRAAIR
jgi:hypothetical protein